MSSEQRRQWAIRIAAALCVVVIILVITPHTGLCQAAMLRDPTTHQRLGPCWEFWLNRYQTLLTGLIAIGVAVLSWRGVVGQLAIGEDDRLSRLEANLQAIVIPLSAIETEFVDGAQEMLRQLNVWQRANGSPLSRRRIETASQQFDQFIEKWAASDLPIAARRAFDALKSGVHEWREKIFDIASQSDQAINEYPPGINFPAKQQRHAKLEADLAPLHSAVRVEFEKFRSDCAGALNEIAARRAALISRKISV